MRLLMCFVLKEEVAPFQKITADHVATAQAQIHLTGIGRQNAETALRKFLEKNLPKLVLTCGFAGGLNPELESGDVVFMTGYPALEERLAEADARREGRSRGPILSTRCRWISGRRFAAA